MEASDLNKSLWSAVESGQLELVKSLIESGADVTNWIRDFDHSVVYFIPSSFYLHTQAPRKIDSPFFKICNKYMNRIQLPDFKT